MNFILAHKVEFIIGAWIIFVLSLIRRWWTHTQIVYRPMSVLGLVSLNLAFFISAWYVIQRHRDHLILSVIVWLIAYLFMTTVFFFKGMRMEIAQDDKTDLIYIPVFFFKIIFYVYVPYLLIYFSLITWKASLFDNVFFVVFIMIFKGFIAGVYAGFTLAALLQVYTDDE